MVRLQKFLADAGIASRRACEQVILDGRVTVNGRSTRVLGAKIDPVQDRVPVDGRAVTLKRKLYLALHKPRGMICSRQDPGQRPSVYELLPLEWRSVYTVGRLDFNTEGLIFLTNDGDFSLHLTHPRYGVSKKYLATIDGSVEQSHLEAITHGLRHEGELLRADRAKVLKTGHGTSLVELTLTEGKYHEVRRLFEAQGLAVKRLQRIQIGPIKLGELRSRRWRTLTETEIKSLLVPRADKTGKKNADHRI